MQLTFHGTPATYFDALDPAAPYVPSDFERDGFIHCTDGERRLADTLSAYYSDSPGDWLVLYIDKDRVTSLIKYEDPERVFPHIYGPLNRDAIIAARPIGRMDDGRFWAPMRLTDETPRPPSETRQRGCYANGHEGGRYEHEWRNQEPRHDRYHWHLDWHRPRRRPLARRRWLQSLRRRA